MGDELVERLEYFAQIARERGTPGFHLASEAAAEIARLRAEVEEYKALAIGEGRNYAKAVADLVKARAEVEALRAVINAAFQARGDQGDVMDVLLRAGARDEPDGLAGRGA